VKKSGVSKRRLISEFKTQSEESADRQPKGRGLFKSEDFDPAKGMWIYVKGRCN
jgi:hypothetical protein